MRRVSALHVVVMALVLVPTASRAQESAEEVDPAVVPDAETGDVTTSTDESGGSGEPDDAEAFLAGEEEQPLIEAPVEEQGTGWDEPPDRRFWMVGARWRLIMVPRWLLGAFFDFPTETSGLQLPRSVIVNQSGGVEFTTRKNNFSIVGSVWWAGYFSQSDDDESWFIAEEAGSADDPEFIRSRINLIMFTVDFLYSPMFTDWFGIYVGGGLGFGVNLASANGLDRHEATGSTGGPYDRCDGPGTSPLCESDGYYYPATEADVWPAYPWINILLGLRFKVFRHLEVNVDGGVGLGFLFGLRVNYIF